MEKKRLNFWITIGTNVGVIVGLALLVYELKQTSELTLLQLEQDRYAMFLQGEVALYGDDGADVWAKSVMEPSDLSPAEMRILDGYLSIGLNRSLKVYELEMAGLEEEGAGLTYLKSNLPFDFGNQYAQAWWKHEKQLWSETRFVDMVDAVIEEIDPDYNRNRIMSLQRTMSRSSDRGSGN